MRESGSKLMQAKPEMAELVQPKMEELTAQFDKLEVGIDNNMNKYTMFILR